MKIKILHVLMFLSFGITNVNAQITIRENNVVEKPVMKPQRFDSLSNFVMQKRPIDYKKYIGYKLFFLPRAKNYVQTSKEEVIINYFFSTKNTEIITDRESSMAGNINLNKLSKNLLKQGKKEITNIYKPKYYPHKYDKTLGEFGTIHDSIEGRYFKILDIKGKEPLNKEDFIELEKIDIQGDKHYQLSLKITLLNESNNDTLNWIVDHAQYLKGHYADEFYLLVPYFEKQRMNYLNKNLVLKDKQVSNIHLEKLVDINTGEIVKINFGEVWKCTDVSLLDTKDYYYLSGYFFLKNGNKEVKIEIKSKLLQDYFMLESDFQKQEIEKQKKLEERIKEEQEQKRIIEEEKSNHKNYCISKWGQKMGSLISEGNVILGMSKEMCEASWGLPIDINKTIVKGLTTEQWVYGLGTYLYFDNGILSAIQN